MYVENNQLRSLLSKRARLIFKLKNQYSTPHNCAVLKLIYDQTLDEIALERHAILQTKIVLTCLRRRLWKPENQRISNLTGKYYEPND